MDHKVLRHRARRAVAVDLQIMHVNLRFANDDHHPSARRGYLLCFWGIFSHKIKRKKHVRPVTPELNPIRRTCPPQKKNIQTEYIFNDLLITFLPSLAVQCAVNCLVVPMVIVVIELSEPIRRLREWRKGSINLLINNKIRIETVPLVYGFLLLVTASYLIKRSADDLHCRDDRKSPTFSVRRQQMLFGCTEKSIN